LNSEQSALLNLQNPFFLSFHTKLLIPDALLQQHSSPTYFDSRVLLPEVHLLSIS